MTVRFIPAFNLNRPYYSPVTLPQPEVHTEKGFILTQWHSHALNRIQAHSILAQRRARALRAHSNAFNCIHTRSKAFMCAHFHVGISKKVCSVAFRLTQRCSRALMRIRPHSMITQRHSHALRARSSVFNTHSKAFTCTQSAFKRNQSHSVAVTLYQRHSVRSDS